MSPCRDNLFTDYRLQHLVWTSDPKSTVKDVSFSFQFIIKFIYLLYFLREITGLLYFIFNDDSFFYAPSKYLGDQSLSYGLHFTVRVLISSDSLSVPASVFPLLLRGGRMDAVYITNMTLTNVTEPDSISRVLTLRVRAGLTLGYTLHTYV